MKKRILSLLLAFLLVISSMPTPIFAVDTAAEHSAVGHLAKFTTQYPYLWSDPTNVATQTIVNGNLLPERVKIVGVHVYSSTVTLYEIEAAEGYTWPEEYKQYRYVESTKLELIEEIVPEINVAVVDQNGDLIAEDGLFLPQGEKTTISAQGAEGQNATYQWQICYNNANLLWAELYGATEKELSVSPAMFRNVVDYYGKTFVRCVATVGETVSISDPVPVTLTENTPAVFAASRMQAAATVASNEAVVAAANEEVMPADTTVKYAITVLFKYADTEQSWVAYLAEGKDYILDIPCPEIPGYVPKNGQTRVTRNITDIQSNITIIVEYEPDYMDFVVEHYWQFVDKDEYELHETQTVSGLKTGDYVGSNLHKEYVGFDNLNYDSQTTVAADGSTVVEIYYDREYFMVSVNLNGGYGAEPLCARYGTPIVVPDPQRTGYAFAGWLYDQEGQVHNKLPAAVPAYNTSYTAQWVKADTNFTVAFWYENANDTNYTFVSSVRETAKTGDKVNGADYKKDTFDGRNDQHFTYKSADSNVEVKADGSTVVNVYFSRNTYTLTYYKWKCLHTHGNACCAYTHTQHEKSCISNLSNAVNSSNQTLLENNFPNAVNGSVGYKELKVGSWVVDTYYYVYWDGVWYNLAGTDETVKWNNCPGLHTHGSGCNYSGCTHTAKYSCESDVSNMNHWIVSYQGKFKYGQDVSAIHAAQGAERWCPGACEGLKNADGNYYASYGQSPAHGVYSSMGGGDVTFFQGGVGSTEYKLTFWLETYDGSGSRTLNGINFAQGTTFTAKMGAVGYHGDYVPGCPKPGFKVYQAWTSSTLAGTNGTQLKEGQQFGGNTYIYYNFYYVRATYNLSYFNGSEVVATEVMKYDEPLTSQYNKQNLTMTSPYGSGYAFGGWYLDPECTVPVSWGSTRMPDGGMAVYAKWSPVLHRVSTYLTKDGTKLANYDVYHGNHVTASVSDPVRAGYNFVGWFYEEDGKENAYDFSMPVYKDMTLYAKWTSDTFVEGFVYYKDTAGNTLADPTPIRGAVGDIKTYNAKVGNAIDLAPSDTAYFPNVTSHSVTFGAQSEQNNYTFVYTAKESVAYEVHFIDKDTGTAVATTVLGSSKSASLVFDLQEQNINVKKYTVDAMRKTFALSSDETLNKFYFYFTKDEENATVQVEHYIQNTTGTGYSLYFTEPTTKAKIGTTVTANALTITGFTYDSGATGTVNSVTLPDTGIVLKLYYTRNSYPYQFRFVYTNGSGQEVEFEGSRIISTGKYGVTVNQVAKDFAGYRLTSAGSMSITVAAENPAADANIRTFHYEENQVTIRYQVGAGGGGTVSPGNESIKAITGQATGSTATANTDYVFTGWYSNFACDDSKLVSTNASFIPSKTDGVYTATTYYAKFEEVKVNIHYSVIMPAGANGTATLNKTSESVSIFTGEATGSTIAAIPDGYQFEGWYDSNSNKLSGSAVWVPDMPGEKWVDGTTFYAKFIEQTATITFNIDTVGAGTLKLDAPGLDQSVINQTVNVWTGALESVTATANEGYTFVGWYRDRMLVSADATLHLTKTDAQMWESGTYTAKFERDTADLTIITNGADVNQSYLLVVVGNNGVSLNVVLNGNTQITIRDLPADIYTVVEQGNWSWRQEDLGSQAADLTTGDQTLTFDFGVAEKDRWLSGMDHLQFRKGGN